MDQITKRARLRITGLVQGVYYRASAHEQAQRLGLTGWVRNTGDAAVLLEAQGAPERLEALVTWCRTGPPAARVHDVEVSWIEPHEHDVGFVVHR
jgi:acylphosphatase